MGLDYGFSIFLRAERLESLLRGLSPLLEPTNTEWDPDGMEIVERAPTVLVLGDKELLLPCSAEHKCGRRLQLGEGADQEVSLELSMRFPGDEKIDEYLVGLAPHARDRPQSVGLIYLNISGSEMKLAEFTAASTAMSVLFRESGSIRRTFGELAASCDAELVVLDLENGEYETLEESPRSLKIRENWESDQHDLRSYATELLDCLRQTMAAD